MGNTPFEMEARRERRLAREAAAQKAADDLAGRIIETVNATVIRPGPKSEERECTTVAKELEALKPRIVALILEAD